MVFMDNKGKVGTTELQGVCKSNANPAHKCPASSAAASGFCYLGEA